MKKNKKYFLLPLIAFFLLGQTHIFANEMIDVLLNFQSQEDEKAVNDYILTHITPYIQQLTEEYNIRSEDKDKVSQVYLSKLFKSRNEQRAEHFDYITQGPGVLSFLGTYDIYNNQFAVQFLHIVMPIFATPQVSKRILGTVNQSLDRAMKDSYTKIYQTYVSDFLTKKYKINISRNFTAFHAAIQEIAKDAFSYYDLDQSFINAAKSALTKSIVKSQNISEKAAKVSADFNFSLLFVTEILKTIQPALDKEADDLLQHSTIGKELEQWMKTAPAYNKYSLIGVKDNELESLDQVLDANRKFVIAFDIDTKDTLSKEQKQIWNSQESDNNLGNLQSVFLNTQTKKIGNYYLSLIKENIRYSNSQNSIHLEVMLSKTPSSEDQEEILPPPSKNTPSIKKSRNNNDDSDMILATQEPSINDSIIDADMEKDFELPNKDSKIDSKARKLNMKAYNRLLGDPYKTRKILKTVEPEDNSPNANINDHPSSEPAPHSSSLTPDDMLDQEIEQNL